MSGMSKRKQAYHEEQQRIAELEEYFAANPWRHEWKGEVPIQTRKTRKLFKDEQFQLMRPTLYKEVYV